MVSRLVLLLPTHMMLGKSQIHLSQFSHLQNGMLGLEHWAGHHITIFMATLGEKHCHISHSTDEETEAQENNSLLATPGGSVVKNLPASAGVTGDVVASLGWDDPLEKEMATHSSILAWRIPWTEEPGGLQAMGLQKV